MEIEIKNQKKIIEQNQNDDHQFEGVELFINKNEVEQNDRLDSELV